ncbi:MAG TPA: phosphatase PAP2 family protein [Gaiellaceae bacterium]|nr:phosphatase PAP2 family protein [Gaiellaceae bacterium]
MVQHRIHWLNDLFVALSHLGSTGLIWVLIAALAALLWRRPFILVWVLAGDLIADLTAYGLREAIGRERPAMRFAEPRPLVHVPHDPSFPSGHAATSFACAALLASLAPLPKVPLFALAALIAFSRVYNGVHYPLDVLGGAVLGLAIATALRLLAGARRRSAPGQR